MPSTSATFDDLVATFRANSDLLASDYGTLTYPQAVDLSDLDDDLFYCDNCNQVFPRGEHGENSRICYRDDGHPVNYCSSCVTLTFVCDECGQRHSVQEMAKVGTHGGEDTEYFCKGCLRRLQRRIPLMLCPGCSRWCSMDDRRTASRVVDSLGWVRVCRHCDAHRVNTCVGHGCGTLVMPVLTGRQTCESCRFFTTRCHSVMPYNLSPPEWRPKGQEAAAIGLEIEVEEVDPQASMLQKLSANALWSHCAHDGSLDETGVELVLQPASLDWLRANPEALEHIRKTVLTYGARAWNRERCGIHAHLNRERWSALQLCKLELFIRGNMCWIKDAIARRRGNSYCRYECPQGIRSKLAIYGKHCDNFEYKYTALNLQHAQTAELRIFRSTLRVQSIMAIVEFCDAAYWFTTQSGMNPSAEQFCEFLQKTDYDNLKAQIQRRSNYNFGKRYTTEDTIND